MMHSDALDRIRALPLWRGPVEVEPLQGGLSNASFLVRDGMGRHVVRIGRDFPFHHVFREREAMVARAAHMAGFGPAVEHAEPGLMVTAFIDAATCTPADIRKNRGRLAALLARFHGEMPAHVEGPAFLFWVFHMVRDYARTLAAGRSRHAPRLPDLLAIGAELDRAQVALPLIFGHNDLLPGNLLDDGRRFWLIDYEYAGFGTALFDLAGAASNAGMTPAEADEFLALYLGAAPDPAFRRAYAAMQCASLLREAMWSMVSELHLTAPGADYAAYTAENLEKFEKSLRAYRETYG